MQVSGWLLCAFFVVAVAVVMTVRWIGKRNTLGGRKPVSLADMYRQDMTIAGTSFDVFEKVLIVIGQAYGIDPEKLRPSDELKTFYGLDSWVLGEGTERLNNRLVEEFGIIKFETEPESILELVIEVGKQVKSGTE